MGFANTCRPGLMPNMSAFKADPENSGLADPPMIDFR